MGGHTGILEIPKCCLAQETRWGYRQIGHDFKSSSSSHFLCNTHSFQAKVYLGLGGR